MQVRSFEVESLTVRQMLHQHDISNVLVVLIDTEGFDWQVSFLQSSLVFWLTETHINRACIATSCFTHIPSHPKCNGFCCMHLHAPLAQRASSHTSSEARHIFSRLGVEQISMSRHSAPPGLGAQVAAPHHGSKALL